MRKLVAALVCASALAVPGAAPAQQASWNYAYVEGVATATETDNHGRVTATFTCRPPEGDIVITDYTLARSARRAGTAAVRIGQGISVNVPTQVGGRGRNRAVTINLPQRPPILAGVQPSDSLQVTINNQTRSYGDGSGARMKEVAYACWGS